jgi:4-carboxymuconolactone decarboxylase
MMHRSIKIGLILLVFGLKSVAQSPPAMLQTIFPEGTINRDGNFKGNVWVTQLLPADTTFNAAIGNVVFEPGAHSNWHLHPGGQTLVVLDGVGYYQEKGKDLQMLRKGAVVRCPPDVEHWHGAAQDHWFVQMAITPEHQKGRVIWLRPVTEMEYQVGKATSPSVRDKPADLAPRHQHIGAIASFVAKGDLTQLDKALHRALQAGMTIHELKETIVHLYAYCGFPRSIQGLNTLMAVLETRKAQGLVDVEGMPASPAIDTTGKYERGKKVLEALTGQPQIAPPIAGYGAFSPEMDVFLKEHLFADLFGRDVLNYTDREVATISALVNLGGVAPMLKSHLGIALHLGMTEAQLHQLLDVVAYSSGKVEADAGRKILEGVLAASKNK